MTSYASGASADVARRPATLRTAVVLGLVGGIGAVAWGALLLTIGKSLLRPLVTDQAQQIVGDAVSAGAVGIDDLVDVAYQLFQSRAAIWLFIGVIGIAMTLLAARGRAWARIVLTIVALGALGLAVRDLTDMVPGLLKALDAVAALGFLVATVCHWLPASRSAFRASRAG